jgi:hypothetical protein
MYLIILSRNAIWLRTKKIDEKVLSISSKDSPSSIAFVVKNSSVITLVVV